jgi:hypothetical protein
LKLTRSDDEVDIGNAGLSIGQHWPGASRGSIRVGNMATCRVSASLGRASRALLLLAAATTALAPQRSLPVRCASRSRSRVVVFADDDVETLRDQAAKLRAEVEVLQAEAAKERAEELKRNPPPPEPEKKAEAPEKKAVAALEADDDAGFSFPNPFGGGDDAPPKRAVSSSVERQECFFA